MNNDTSGIQQEGRVEVLASESASGSSKLEKSRRVYLEGPPEQLPADCKLIEGFPLYCVSRSGEVFSCRTRGGKFVEWTKMTPAPNRSGNGGRLFVSFRKEGRLIPKQVHLLVLTAFVGPCPVGLEGCHNDGNGLHNRLGNLRWDTHKANMADRVLHGTDPAGIRNPAAVLDDSKVIEIRRLHRSGVYQKDIAPMFGVSKQCVQVVCARETWQHVSDE